MLVYLLIFSAIVFILSVVFLVAIIKDYEDDDNGGIAFFSALTVLSGIAVGFSIALLVQS